MKVLVLGGGGREHALVWALKRSKRVTELVCAPGNGGIAEIARCLPLELTDLPSIIRVSEAEKPSLIVIGPEVPLALGAVDALIVEGFRTFGPTQAAAQLETSKAFAKEFMQRHEIPTAAHAVCTSVDDVVRELRSFSVPVVLKASGLAAGKGVVICDTKLEAERTAAAMFDGTLLGAVEREVIVEEFLAGEEVSFFAVCDGKNATYLAAAQDHKRVGEGDTGPNTGGMGAYSTDYLLTPEMVEWLTENVAQRVVHEMAMEGVEFKGVLFCGMMMTERGPMVLEFNTRFGDPETQAILVRLDSDVVDLIGASIDGTLAEMAPVRLRPGASVCVIAASGGYPGRYSSGKVISGLENDGKTTEKDGEMVVVFHSGTAVKDGAMVTAGGRVLGVTARAATLREALRLAYGRLEGISFEGMRYRRDIGHRAVLR